MMLTHVPPFRQGDGSHSFTSTVQRSPVNPRHLQMGPSPPSSQIPPFLHGLGLQWRPYSQRFPLSRVGHSHRKSLFKLWHCPPKRQGEEAQGSLSISHRRPRKRMRHWQTYPVADPGASLHVPPLRQGCEPQTPGRSITARQVNSTLANLLRTMLVDWLEEEGRLL